MGSYVNIKKNAIQIELGGFSLELFVMQFYHDKYKNILFTGGIVFILKGEHGICMTPTHLRMMAKLN